jgi:hypothetical protein
MCLYVLPARFCSCVFSPLPVVSAPRHLYVGAAAQSLRFLVPAVPSASGSLVGSLSGSAAPSGASSVSTESLSWQTPANSFITMRLPTVSTVGDLQIDFSSTDTRDRQWIVPERMIIPVQAQGSFQIIGVPTSMQSAEKSGIIVIEPGVAPNEDVIVTLVVDGVGGLCNPSTLTFPARSLAAQEFVFSAPNAAVTGVSTIRAQFNGTDVEQWRPMKPINVSITSRPVMSTNPSIIPAALYVNSALSVSFAPSQAVNKPITLSLAANTASGAPQVTWTPNELVFAAGSTTSQIAVLRTSADTTGMAQLVYSSPDVAGASPVLALPPVQVLRVLRRSWHINATLAAPGLTVHESTWVELRLSEPLPAGPWSVTVRPASIGTAEVSFSPATLTLTSCDATNPLLFKLTATRYGTATVSFAISDSSPSTLAAEFGATPQSTSFSVAGLPIPVQDPIPELVAGGSSFLLSMTGANFGSIVPQPGVQCDCSGVVNVGSTSSQTAGSYWYGSMGLRFGEVQGPMSFNISLCTLAGLRGNGVFLPPAVPANGWINGKPGVRLCGAPDYNVNTFYPGQSTRLMTVTSYPAPSVPFRLDLFTEVFITTIPGVPPMLLAVSLSKQFLDFPAGSSTPQTFMATVSGAGNGWARVTANSSIPGLAADFTAFPPLILNVKTRVFVLDGTASAPTDSLSADEPLNAIKLVFSLPEAIPPPSDDRQPANSVTLTFAQLGGEGGIVATPSSLTWTSGQSAAQTMFLNATAAGVVQWKLELSSNDAALASTFISPIPSARTAVNPSTCALRRSCIACASVACQWCSTRNTDVYLGDDYEGRCMPVNSAASVCATLGGHVDPAAQCATDWASTYPFFVEAPP